VTGERLVGKTRQHAENLPAGEFQCIRFELADDFEEGVGQIMTAAKGMRGNICMKGKDAEKKERHEKPGL
jgi:hypothetical protein